MAIKPQKTAPIRANSFQKFVYDKFVTNLGAESAVSLKTITNMYDIIINKWLVMYLGDIAELATDDEDAEKRMNFAKKVCEDVADLEMNEDWTLTCDNDDAYDYIRAGLADNNFYERANQHLEIFNALGTGAFVEYWDGEAVRIDFIRADMIAPLEVVGGAVRNSAFMTIIKNGDRIRGLGSVHIKDKDGYSIYNVRANIKDNHVAEDEIINEKYEDGTEYMVKSPVPLFQIVRPSAVNVIDPDCGFGMSRFAKATDTIALLDTIYSSFDNEFDIGRKMMIVHELQTKFEVAKNRIERIFNKRKSIIFGLDMGENPKDPVKFIDPTLRVEEHIAAMDKALSIFSDQCGLGADYYLYTNQGVKTATEVNAVSNKLVRAVKKDELVLRHAIEGMCRGILALGNMKDGKSFDLGQAIKVTFDNGIFRDEQAERLNAQMDLGLGVMSREEYRMKMYGETADVAKKAIMGIDSATPVVDIFNGNV